MAKNYPNLTPNTNVTDHLHNEDETEAEFISKLQQMRRNNIPYTF